MPAAKNATTPPTNAPAESSLRHRRLVVMGHWLLALLLIGTCCCGFYYARQYVEQTVTASVRAPKVQFVNHPRWMSSLLAQQLARSVAPPAGSSVFDHDLLVRTTERLRANAWITELRQVRRTFDATPGDTIVVDCDFRAPMALVRYDSDYWFVDAAGILLPEKFTFADVSRIIYAADGTLIIRVIDGVRKPPPAQPGDQWIGEDLTAGLEMISHLSEQPFTQDIPTVDVSNFASRIDPNEPQLVLVTRFDTRIYWGRPWSAPDWFVETAPENKMEHIRRVIAEYGRVDAKERWIDVRFDKPVLFPETSTTAADSSR